MKIVSLKNYSNTSYYFGSFFKRSSWYFVSLLFIHTMIPFPSRFKVGILKLFGAKIGKNVRIKPNVQIKYPWKLEIGNDVWIGEGTWIDNLAIVRIGDNICISQNAYLLTGNHNYKSEYFELMIKEIIIENGVWIGAKSVVCPGVICKSHCVLSVGSIATSNMEPYGIYQGNPAIFKMKRNIR